MARRGQVFRRSLQHTQGIGAGKPKPKLIMTKVKLKCPPSKMNEKKRVT
jgi:hypothetical protein